MANDINAAVDMLKEILDSPDAGEKIGAMLEGLGGGDSSSGPDLSALSSVLGGPDSSFPMDMAMKMAEKLKAVSGQDDARVSLLKALKPYLRSTRQESVDSAVKILGVLKLMPLLGDIKEIL